MISRRHFSALLVSGCQNSRRARAREFSDAAVSQARPRVKGKLGAKSDFCLGARKEIADVPGESGARSRKKFRAFSASSRRTNRTADLILIRGAVFWGSRANRGSSMIHARRHESGISPSRGPLSRSGPAVSCFFPRSLTHFLAFYLLRFSPVRHLVLRLPSHSRRPLCLFFPTGFPPRDFVRNARLVLLYLSSFVSSSPSSLLILTFSILYLRFSICAMLFHAWLTARNRRSYRDYVHPECTDYRPFLETILFFSSREIFSRSEIS